MNDTVTNEGQPTAAQWRQLFDDIHASLDRLRQSLTPVTEPEAPIGSEAVARHFEARGEHQAAEIQRLTGWQAISLLNRFQVRHPDEFAEQLAREQEIWATARARVQREQS